MKLAYTSDLHFEFGTQAEIRLQEKVDVLILSGDIDDADNVVNRAVEIANGNATEIVFVCGNHEFYGNRVDKAYRKISEQLQANPNVHFLNDSEVQLFGYTFLGGTGWTDFELNGNKPLAMQFSREMMNDYRRIQYHDPVSGSYRKLLPKDTAKMNLVTKQYIFDRLSQLDRSKCVVITHHGPTHMSLDPNFVGDPLNPAYASNWGNDIAYNGPRAWFHGHIHTPVEYECGDTTVYCNPWGYAGQRQNPDFKFLEL